MRITHLILNGAMAVTILGAAAQTTAPPAPPTAGSGSQDGGISEFTVASIRQNALNDGRWRLGFTFDGYSALGVTVKQLIEDAYGIYDDDRIRGLPKWADSEKYNLEAKVDSTQLPAWHEFDADQRSAVLRTLLRDRFQLSVREVTETRPVYALVIAKAGLKLHETPLENVPVGLIKGSGAKVTRIQRGQLATEWQTTTTFADLLFRLGLVDRHIVDRTGLTGRYDITLNWEPADAASPTIPGPPEPSASAVPGAPAIFAALREQLGLELKPSKGPIGVLVIDNVERPSAN
jgi:uncharacterized protein (TIGR03435 family)